MSRLLASARIRLADVGAAGGLSERWRAIASALHVVAFEPDARSGAGDSAPGLERSVVPLAAAAADGQATMYLTRKPRCSSLLRPNRAVVDRYDDPSRYEVVQMGTVPCTSIDTVLGGRTIDFLKIDTQGTELEVLRGAATSLPSCLGLEIEVEFQPLYEGAALFRDVDALVSELGFEIFDLRRTFFARSARLRDVEQRKGQLVFGDALYFRPWRDVTERSSLLRLAVLMLVYGFSDVVAEMASESPLLSRDDREGLVELCRALTPVPGARVARKDSIVGSGLWLT